jgi:hypothetical protein
MGSEKSLETKTCWRDSVMADMLLIVGGVNEDAGCGCSNAKARCVRHKTLRIEVLDVDRSLDSRSKVCM